MVGGGGGGGERERSMVAEAWKKEIAWIYLPLIGEDGCIVPSGAKTPAVCQLMGTRLKRCQVVGGHGGGGRAPKQEEAVASRLGEVGKGTQCERQASGRAEAPVAPSCIFSLTEERRDQRWRRVEERKARSDSHETTAPC